MTKKGKNEALESPAFKRKGARPRPFLALLFVILTVLTALALYDYSPQQGSWWTTEPPSEHNIIGKFGAETAYRSIWTFGAAAWLIPAFLAWAAYLFSRRYAYVIGLKKLLSILILLVSGAVFWQVAQTSGVVAPSPALHQNHYPFDQKMGGWIGSVLYEDRLSEWLGTVGTLVVFGILTVGALAFLLVDNVLSDLSKRTRESYFNWRAGAGERARQREERTRMKLAQKQAKESRAKAVSQVDRARKASKESAQDIDKAPSPAATANPPPFPEKKGLSPFGRKKKAILAPPAPEEAPAKSTPAPFEPIEENASDAAAAATKKRARPQPAAPLPAPTATPEPRSNLRIIASEQTRKAAVQLPAKKGDYVFPPMKLLPDSPDISGQDNSEAHQQTAEALVQTLEEFGIKVTMGEVHAGPVITRYDVYPAPGVRVERIANLDKNLALGLKALSVRILAPVPGRGCVGIEVPNREAQSVFIRDILESEDWATTKAEIPIALGKEVSGKPLIADLTKMPHLLIAGSTGAGKTVCINSIITSLLYHSSPEDLRFVMVDPKIVEMQIYNTLPHMMIPVVTDPKKVPNALRYLLNEMEKRYQMFAEVGVRNIAGYNAKMAKNRRERAEAEALAAELDAHLTPEERAASANAVSVPRDPNIDGELPTRIPYVVCIVDELADLMMVAPADIETGIARLAQLARAAGIHLILATQRPSVNVITGVIKANLPSRISFKVASKVDSRTILDTGGADLLIGKGDMLFLPPGSADLVRSQGAFIGDDEIARIVEFISERNGDPVFDEQFQRSVEEGADEEGGDGAEGNWDDELVPNAIEVIRTSKRASTSMLQRRLKIGYNRAARIMEILEAEGIVGPENGSSPREILRDLDTF